MSATGELHTLGRWTGDRAIATPERVAVDDRGVVLTYRELEARAASLADAFRAAGYCAGDRVATVTGNSADHVVLFFACAKAALVLVPLSWRLSPRELAEQLTYADPALLLVEEEFGALVRAAAARLQAPPVTMPLNARSFSAALPSRSGPSDGGVQRRARDDDGLLMIFTSGTGGSPKGAVLTHANCFWTNLSLSRTAEISATDVVLAVMPQYHVGGWNVQPLLAWWAGATVVLERTFDAGRVLQLIADRRITTMMGVPANYRLLAEHPRFAQTDLSTLRHAIVGGAPMPVPLLRTWHARDVTLTQGYGLTEAAPNVLCLPDEDAYRRAGSSGRPYPHVDVALADPISGVRLDGVARGELLVRGPNVFAGYFRDAERTRAALHDGWLHTGDVASRDADGYFTIIDRLKDIYITGGESVSPSEVENVLFEHPAVADVGVAGVPDERWGEVGVAWVALHPGQAVDDRALTEYARANLAAYKVPHAFRFVSQVPRSATNKVLRRRIREEWENMSGKIRL